MSKARLSDHIEALSTHMSHIEAPLATERQAACQVAPHPATDNAGAPLTPCRLKPCPSLAFLATVRALDGLWGPLLIYSWHSLVSFELLCAEELCEFLLSCVDLRWLRLSCYRCIFIRIRFNQCCSTIPDKFLRFILVTTT